VAQINVGAATEVEMKEKKARVEDALHACRAAVEEGILPGGGVAVLRARKALDKLRKKADGDERAGMDIVYRAVAAPIKQIAANCGLDGSVIASKVEENTEHQLRLQRPDPRVRRPGADGRHRPDQGRARRPAERREHRGPAAHHRGGDRRAQGQEEAGRWPHDHDHGDRAR
jgi:hypothetical protein